MPIPWIIISITILILLLLIVLIFKRKEIMNKPTDYRAFFIIGVAFIPIGIGTDNYAFIGLGVIYILLGLKNRKTWGKKIKPSEKEAKDKLKLFYVLLGLLILAVLIFFFIQTKEEVTNFEDCIAAGNPAMESYPRQCIHKDQHFVEDISWRTDSIELRQHEIEKTYGCFGCSTATDGPALCIDPIFEMKSVEETPSRHCNSDFEVIENL